MSDHFQTIYEQHADRYDDLVACEDVAGNLERLLRDVCPWDGARIVEFGAGTGRLTRMISNRARSVVALDGSFSMLRVARERRVRNSGVRLAVAMNEAIPVRSGCADLAIEGWSFGHVVTWRADEWRASVDRTLGEMMRVLADDGQAVLIETLGTGTTEPAPPNEGLAALYEHWESIGFTRRWARTDYRFPSQDEAQALTRFFFGREVEGERNSDGTFTIRECTGVWSLRRPFAQPHH